ncbi:MAG: biotin attachment protein [Candidatus Melainabacteria bacterium RIFOXYA12_FULL_32_12]|nr:MAG: biotin attachment protein [Candidatus Melainabacteria bacterium RIFOXYA2_FULL_32_9]OGI31217.1 MAG: biotin attachment protein [Candidatus Melainabacteria bacterium RIFOXYA12_FULL_32_12]
MSKKLIKVMDTSFRDGFQSVYGARVLTKDFLPAVEAAKEAGIRHFESGGGARFQSLYFYCNEDAFAMMDAFRKTVGPDVELQTLARGINVVGLESQSSDIIKLHAELFKKHGTTTIRNFDALNDVQNLVYSGKCIVDAGLKHEVTVTMMELPPGCVGAHTPEFYVQVLRNILDAEIPFSSVCFKDASGTSTPSKVYETIKQAKAMIPEGIEISFHTHETAGTGVLAYKAALDAGADIINLAMAPVSGGTSQPDIITMWHALRDTEYDLGIDINKILEAEEVFKECMKDYFMPPEALAVDPLIIYSPMPGGALTANTQMMRDNNILDKYPEVIKAMSEVVKLGGFGTSVTPVSQFYFQQAFNNVMFNPWSKIADGYGKMVLGYFGKTPIPPDQEVVKIASEQLGLEPTTRNPLEINDEDPKKGIEAAKKMLQAANLPETDENIFITATCKEKGIAFLKGEATVGVRKNIKPKESKIKAEGYTVTVNNKNYAVVIDGYQARINGKTYTIDVKEGIQEPEMALKVKNQAASTDAIAIKSPLPGTILRIKVNVGDSVQEGKTLLVLEAMKMETKIKATKSGTVSSITVSPGDQVETGQILVWIN